MHDLVTAQGCTDPPPHPQQHYFALSPNSSSIPSEYVAQINFGCSFRRHFGDDSKPTVRHTADNRKYIRVWLIEDFCVDKSVNSVSRIPPPILSFGSTHLCRIKKTNPKNKTPLVKCCENSHMVCSQKDYKMHLEFLL